MRVLSVGIPPRVRTAGGRAHFHGTTSSMIRHWDWLDLGSLWDWGKPEVFPTPSEAAVWAWLLRLSPGARGLESTQTAEAQAAASAAAVSAAFPALLTLPTQAPHSPLPHLSTANRSSDWPFMIFNLCFVSKL